MILSDLLQDADKAGDVAGTFQVLLATRTVDGQEIDPGQVQVSDAGVLQVDLSAQEIDVLPARFMEPTGQGLTIADVRSKLAEQPEIADFALTGVIGFKRLADGGNAQRTNPHHWHVHSRRAGADLVAASSRAPMARSLVWRLTIHSSRSRFAARLNSGVRRRHEQPNIRLS